MSKEETDKALSISAAASERAEAPAVIDHGKVISYRELLELVRQKDKELDDSVPYHLTASPCLDTIVSVFALLERKQPILLFHPGLTDYEKRVLAESVAHIDQKLPEDAAVILFTSGTTGLPKPAVLTRRALIASAEASRGNIPLNHDDVWLLSISPARIGGFSILTRSLAARSAIALGPRFKVEAYLRTMEEAKITYSSIVPTMLMKVFDEAPDWRPNPRLKALLVGGAPTSAKLKEEAEKKGIPLIMTYGMTETASNVVTTPFSLRFHKTEGSGRINPGVELESRDGHIFVRGDMLMSGYWGRKPLEKGEWFDSGDIGEVGEDGFVRIFARRTDMIISGGENVYPAEVEEALERLPSVKNALVLGKPDETWGSIVTALLVPRDKDQIPKAEDIVKALEPYLAAYKSPRRIAWVEELPKTSAGKPNRNPAYLDGLMLTALHYAGKH